MQLTPGTPTLWAPVPPPEETVLEYDRRGLLTRARNKDADIVFARDALGRVIEERSTTGEETHVIRSRYDAAGHRAARSTSQGHETSFDVDARGQLRGLSFAERRPSTSGAPAGDVGVEPGTLGPAWTSVWRRDAEGAELERKLPGGVVSRWDRDLLGRGRAQHVVSRGGPGLSRGYEWRPEDRLASIVDSLTGPLTIEHDARGHLVAAHGPGGDTQYRSPDSAGLVYRSKDRSDRTYGKGGVLQRLDGAELLHDADGQLVEKRLPGGKTWKYRWDGAGQLAEVTRPDGGKVSFAYDALGRRVRKTYGATTTTYVWDGNDLVHELRGDAPAVTWEFEPGTFAPLAKVEAGRRYGVVTDHLGTPVALYDEAGALAWRAQLDLYGAAKPDVMKTPCPWRFPGQYEDEETGLHYNRFRYYDPQSGAYISQDPIGLLGGSAIYGYPSDPTNLGDPLGLSTCVAGKKFKEHYLDHRSLIERLLGKKYPKWKVDEGTEFLQDIATLIDSGRLVYIGEGTLKKGQPIAEIFRGEGLTLVTKKVDDVTKEFVTVLESGKGMDLGITIL